MTASDTATATAAAATAAAAAKPMAAAEPEPEAEAEDERTIFDICMDFEEAVEADADEDEADEATGAALLALVREAGALLKKTDEEEDREMFVGEDGLQGTLAAIGRHMADVEWVKAGWAVVQHTCMHQPPHRRLVADEGGLELLARTWAAHEADSAVLSVLLGTVNQLVFKDERNKVMLNGLGVTASIMAALEKLGADDDVFAAALLDTLYWMLRDDDDSVEQSFRADMIDALWEHADILNVLIELLEADRCEAVLHNALRVFKSVTDSEKGAEEAVDNGVVDLVLEFLKERLDQHSVLSTSCQLLKSLAMHIDAAKESLLSELADELLLGLLRSHTAHAKVLEAAMDLLLSIMFRDESTAEKLVGKGLIPAICAGLTAHPDEKLLFRSSCMMLRELCRIEDNQRIMKEDGVEKLMMAGMDRFKEAGGAGTERGYKGGIPFQEYGRDVLRDCHSEHYVLGTHSMGVSLLDLDKGHV
jgi:hypothetical protein